MLYCRLHSYRVIYNKSTIMGVTYMVKKINLAIALFTSFILYKSLSIWGKIGIIRDEYGITGEDGISFSYYHVILLVLLPVVIIFLNLIAFFTKRDYKNWVKYSIIFISAIAVIISTLLMVLTNNAISIML